MIAIDLDEDALAFAKENWESFEFEDQEIHFIHTNVEELRVENNCFYSGIIFSSLLIYLMSLLFNYLSLLGTTLLLEHTKPIDVVIMNPPFGTKKKGIDMVFLQKALEVSSCLYILKKINPTINFF